MAREFSRTQRVGDFIQQELARLIQSDLRDPRVGMVSVTGVEVSRDLTHAKVFFTQLNADNAEAAKEVAKVLNGAAGYLRSQLAREANMRTVPRLHFRFDESVGRGRSMEALLQEVRAADAALHPEQSTDSDQDA